MSTSQTVDIPDLELDTHRESVTAYESRSMEEYASRWYFPMGLGEMAANDTRRVDADGAVSVAAVPFETGADEIHDHAKYFAASRETFAMPEDGSLQFSADISAETPGTQPGRVVHGHYTDTPDGGRPYAQPTIEGQQAALMLDMQNVETGQLFDWFVSGRSAFALIERLPSSVRNPTLSAEDPDYVGLDKIHTQIIKVASLEAGATHNYAIRYTRDATRSFVEYLFDGELFARVDHVGIPLDTQGVRYTGVYPSYNNAPGEELGPRMDTFVIVHGLYSVLDAFPFQHADAPEQAVSVPVAERLFGQGARGKFSKFEVTTISN